MPPGMDPQAVNRLPASKTAKFEDRIDGLFHKIPDFEHMFA